MRYLSTAVLVYLSLFGPGLAEKAGAASDCAIIPAYGYNYPHDIPFDYVYRTGRIFVPGATQATEEDTGWDFFHRETLPADPMETATELKLKVRELTQQLLDHANEPMADQSRIIVTTFVNLHHLYKTSGLGRAISEQMISEFQRSGIEVIEVRMTPSIQIREGFGEYGLSRDMAQLSYVQDAQAVVVGTYTVSDGQVVVNARLLQQGDGLVLSSGSIALPANAMVRCLLKDEAVPPPKAALVEMHDFSAIRPTE
ncbi:MAG: hypothetical protein HY885_12230 [Deltaproteobacteria bacterium]|nr:hypothetical protein [Deltaproteobacteria bacterium]